MPLILCKFLWPNGGLLWYSAGRLLSHNMLCNRWRSRDGSVGIATRRRAGRPRHRSAIFHAVKGIISSPKRPDRLWRPPRFLSNSIGGFTPGTQSGRGVKLHHTHFTGAKVNEPGVLKIFLQEPSIHEEV
jgi:hypothetical protein